MSFAMLSIFLDHLVRNIFRVAKRGVPIWPAVSAPATTTAAVPGSIVGTWTVARVRCNRLADDFLSDLFGREAFREGWKSQHAQYE